MTVSGAIIRVLFVLAVTISTHATRINIKNQCPFAVSACDEAHLIPATCRALSPNNGAYLKDVGSVWDGGIIWGFPSSSADVGQGILAKPQANLAEFTIGLNGQDSYDLSNVDGYNLAMMINPTDTKGWPRDGLRCGTPVCNIPDLAAFCKSPNYLTGAPGNGCKNAVGPTTPAATDSTRAFKAACPTSYSFHLDDRFTNPGVVYGCNLGSDYEVVFCP